MAETISILSKLAFAGTTGTYTNVTTTDSMEAALGASAKGHHTTQAVGTSKEILSTGDVTLTAQHWIRLENKDTVNYVTIYARLNATPTDTVVGIIKAGEMWGPVRAGAQTGIYPAFYLEANTAACNVEVVVIDG